MAPTTRRARPVPRPPPHPNTPKCGLHEAVAVLWIEPPVGSGLDPHATVLAVEPDGETGCTGDRRASDVLGPAGRSP
ncbi:hypothetical protein [Streptomyces phaeoluteigriseus]|uniref:hypothetical protein n=1 Tax=Streptomyces phaeoluteigriseus TaxID=114686 RepID=UPI0036C8384C